MIHFIFVPLILGTGQVFLLKAFPSFSVHLFSGALVLNPATLVSLLYSLYYLHLEPIAGLLWAAGVGLPLSLLATHAVASDPNAGQKAFLLHLLSWYMQVRSREDDVI